MADTITDIPDLPANPNPVGVDEIRTKVNSLNPYHSPEGQVGGGGASYELWIGATTGPNGVACTPSDDDEADRSFTALYPDEYAWYKPNAPWQVFVPQTSWIHVGKALEWAENNLQGARICLVLFDDADWWPEAAGSYRTASFKEVGIAGAFNGALNRISTSGAHFEFESADVNTVTDVITVTDNDFVNGDAVGYWSDGSDLTGVTAYTKYYVVNKSGDDIQLSLTEGGSAVDIEGVGSGTFSIYKLRDPTAVDPQSGAKNMRLRPTLTVGMQAATHATWLDIQSGDCWVNSVEIKFVPHSGETGDVAIARVLQSSQGRCIVGYYTAKFTFAPGGVGDAYDMDQIDAGVLCGTEGTLLYLLNVDFQFDNATTMQVCLLEVRNSATCFINPITGATDRVVVGRSIASPVSVSTCQLLNGARVTIFANEADSPIFQETACAATNRLSGNDSNAGSSVRIQSGGVIYAAGGNLAYTVCIIGEYNVSSFSYFDYDTTEVVGTPNATLYTDGTTLSSRLSNSTDALTAADYTFNS